MGHRIIEGSRRIDLRLGFERMVTFFRLGALLNGMETAHPIYHPTFNILTLYGTDDVLGATTERKVANYWA